MWSPATTRAAPARRLGEGGPAIFIGFLEDRPDRAGRRGGPGCWFGEAVARDWPRPSVTVVGMLVTEQILSGIMLIGVLVGVVVFTPVPEQAVRLAVLSGVFLSSGSWRPGSRSPGASSGRRTALMGPSTSSAGPAPARHQLHIDDEWPSGGQATSAVAALVGLMVTIKPWATYSPASTALRAYGIDQGLGAAGVVFLALNPAAASSPSRRATSASSIGDSRWPPRLTRCRATWRSPSRSARADRGRLGVGIGSDFLRSKAVGGTVRRQVEDGLCT